MLSDRDMDEAMRIASVTGETVGRTIQSLVEEIRRMEKTIDAQADVILKQRTLLAQARGTLEPVKIKHPEWAQDAPERRYAQGSKNDEA